MQRNGALSRRLFENTNYSIYTLSSIIAALVLAEKERFLNTPLGKGADRFPYLDLEPMEIALPFAPRRTIALAKGFHYSVWEKSWESADIKDCLASVPSCSSWTSHFFFSWVSGAENSDTPKFQAALDPFAFAGSSLSDFGLAGTRDA
jgi:hypothetical protein